MEGDSNVKHNWNRNKTEKRYDFWYDDCMIDGRFILLYAARV